MKTKMFILAPVFAAALLASLGVMSHSTSAYAQGSPLGDIPVIGDLMGGGENQSQQNQSQQNQSQQNQSQQNQSQQNQSQQNQSNQSGGPLGNIPVIGEQLENMNPMK
jgi:hypothetical protein